MKTIVQFDPTGNPVEAERHYTSVHIPLVQRIFRHHSDDIFAYLPHRVVAQYDAAGGFRRRPDAWRFVVLHHGESLYLPPEWKDIITADHAYCLENIASYGISEERTLVLSSAHHRTSAKYLMIDERTADGDDALDAITARACEASGVQAVTRNRVAYVLETTSLAAPGQRTTDKRLETPVTDILEFWFDHYSWGRDFFATESVRTVLHAWSPNHRAYEVDVELAFSRAAPSDDP